MDSVLVMFYLLNIIAILPLVLTHGDEEPLSSSGQTSTLDITMPGARPAYADHYLCTSYPVDNGYVVGYKALASANTAHHILMYACSAPYKYNGVWDCGSICRGSRGIMFAWAKNAQPLHLPKDVGYQIGKDADVNYIVMQIHYAHMLPADQEADHSGIQLEISKERQKFKAGIFLMMSTKTIPPHNPAFHLDSSCRFTGPTTIYPFGFRTHAHALSTVISGYLYNGTWNEVGKGNPQWPQAFYPVKDKIAIKKGDSLVARCTYNTTGKTTPTQIGSTASDEMCNFYMMYYTDAVNGETTGNCYSNAIPSLVKDIPADSDQRLPPNPLLDEMAAGHAHHHHTPDTDVTPPLSSSPQLTALVADSDWPKDDITIGQVGGLANDKEGNLYVFHRASRMWDDNSFDVRNIFQHQTEPIMENTLVKMNREGHVLKEWGANQFYMPHGITVDDAGNIWLTDVALHQVMRFPTGSNKTDLVLGMRFEPGHSDKHFCKPSDVAVMSTGEFFVADGYCNSRIMKFSKTGELIGQWGSKSQGEPAQGDGYPPTNTFDIVHSVTVAEDKNLVCACDRENARIQCYDLNGIFIKQITSPRFGATVYGVDYCPRGGGMLFAISGQSHYYETPPSGQPIKPQGFTIDINSGEITGTWQPSNDNRAFSFPHDVTVDSEHQEVYVGEIGPNVVWKFVKTTVKGETETQAGVKKDNIPVKTGTSSVSSPDDGTSSGSSPDVIKVKKFNKEDSSQASLIIGALLVIPVILIGVVAIIMKLRSQGKLKCCSLKRNKKFNYFTSHKGFDPLSTEDSDHEIDPLNDSDGDDFTIPHKA